MQPSTHQKPKNTIFVVIPQSNSSHRARLVLVELKNILEGERHQILSAGQCKNIKKMYHLQT